MTRSTGIVFFVLLSLFASAQGDQQVRTKADALFEEKNYVTALPLYSQLVSLSPGDRVLNYKFGACLLFSGTDKDKSIGHLKFATQDPSIPPDAWYWLGRAYHLNYQFKDALTAYQRYQGTGSKKELEGFPIAALDKQCRNGQNLLSNLKEIAVHNKVEVDDTEFFRFYELGDIGGKIVVLPDELKTTLDKKSKRRTLVYLPAKGGPIYYASYGKDGKTGLDIYRTELVTNGTFATPVKLAGYVNTDQDEDFAFLHPDGKGFYFSSKGHNSMGGYDVFRSAYDKVSETFGPPENMDFAVNTPDDDVFYMTDAENKQACFASGRGSQQGKLHVYRVSTAQVPVVVTVLKGTYASALDKNDRTAHIVVEDAVTRERVADVRTDINGSYVLSVPRSGRFRYLVECGPSGRTHSAVVEVPRANAARAFRQELELISKGDQEELVIRNYFDTPLEEDMIALMMEEIKRRARLDVTGEKNVVAQRPADPEPVGDVLTQAGFAGDVTEAKAVQLAKDDANALEELARALDRQSTAAYDIAQEAAQVADEEARKATSKAEAANAETDEAARNVQMREAAQLRQGSRAANLRARAAYRAAQEIDAERMAVQQRANTASKLATDLGQAVSTKQQAATLSHLRTLKQRLDTKSGPEGDITLAERTRRTLAEQEKEAARRMNQATSKRSEETEFADRIERARRERDAANGKARKEELSRAIAEQEQQLAYLHAEVEGAFTTAREHEVGTMVMRGQQSLIGHLATTTETATGKAPTKEEVAQLGQRIAGNESRIASISVDARFDGNFAEPASALEARSFNWQPNASAGMIAANTVPTVAMERDGRNDAVHADGRTTTVPATAGANGQVRRVDVPQVPISANEELVNAGQSIGIINAQEEATVDAEPATAATGPMRATTTTATTAAGGPDQPKGTTSPGNANDAGATGTQAVDRIPVEDQLVGAGRTGQEVTPDNVGEVPVGRNDQLPEASGDASETLANTVTSADDTFLLENEKAELQQAIAAERNAARREELRAQLVNVEQRLTAANTAAEENEAQESELNAEGVDMQRMPITFYPETKENDIITLVYPNYESDKRKLQALPDPAARAEGLSGLELMLADSLRGEMVRQAAVLELAPQQGPIALPRIERLRTLRQARLQEADRIATEAGAAEVAEDTPREGLSRSTSRVDHPVGEDPVADRFIRVLEDRQDVYASKIEHRSCQVDEAIGMKEADLARMEVLDTRIDSIEASMVGLPRKEYDKLRRDADKLIDERMIIRADLGQRSAYLTKEEWRTTADSLKVIDKKLTSLGLAPNENLLLMSEGMRTNAKTQYAEAEAMRKRADRTDDIMLRDSLFRTAYGKELEALREMDRSITVKTYLLSDGFTRGETLAYEEVARRALGITEEVLLADARRPKSVTNTVPVNGTDTSNEVAVVSSVNVPAEPGRAAPVQEEALAETQQPGATAAATGTEGSTGTSAQRTTAGPDQTRDTDTAESAPQQPAVITTTPAGQGDQVNTATSTAAVDATSPEVQSARAEANALADRTVNVLPSIARMPAHLYEGFLKGETVILTADALDPTLDVDLLASHHARASRESVASEQRSLVLADQATALEDSAATARKRDRERLLELAVRTRQEADSLHARSLAAAEEARTYEMHQRDAEQAKILRDRLVKYYYLSGEEQALVLDNPDISRYFQMKARALEQLDATAEAEAAARANRELGETLRKEADAVKAEEAAGRINSVGAGAKREVLVSRAELLATRADSLSNIAARLRGAANINEGQAGVLLQGQPAERSTEWMAMEMRARRSEPLLAQVEERALQGGAPGQGAPASTGGAARNADGSTAGTERPGARRITAPFGTDQRSERLNMPRPIAEIPAELAPAMVFPEVLVNDLFEFRPIAQRTPAAIPMDARMPGGIVFKVQIGAFRTPIAEDVFNDMTPVMGENTPNGFIRYTAGLFTGFQQAAQAKDNVRDRGYRDAFVVAYRDGVRIPLGEAMREARKAEQQGATEATSAIAQVAPTTDRTDRGAEQRVVSNGTANTPVPTVSGAGDTVLVPVRTATPEPPATAVIQRPATAPATAAVAAPTTEQILAKYPTTVEEIVASFVPATGATEYYNVPGAAPATQVETIKGLFYTVQVGVYSKPVALDKLFNIVPLNSERTETAKVRYTTGRYADTELARVRKDEAVARGVKDAFITAYLNGKRIPMQEAAALLQQFGPAILAKP